MIERRKKSKKRTRNRQRSLLELGRGGFREGAGRKRFARTKWVRRRGREEITGRHPVHVTICLAEGLPRLRNKPTWNVMRRCFAAGAERFGFRLLHFSVMNNHLHMIAEADDRRALSRGMQGLLIRISRGLNKFWGRSGKVFSDRYHDRILKTPLEVKRALLYVLNNARRHGLRLASKLDPFSSSSWFTGWAKSDNIRPHDSADRPIARARSWLAKTGWRRHGPLCAHAIPGPAE